MSKKKPIILKASEGKILRRISDGELFGYELVLGKTFYLHGEKLETPIDEKPEHYEEIDDVVEQEPLEEVFTPAELSIPEELEPEKEIKPLNLRDIYDMRDMISKLYSVLSPEQKVLFSSL